jgi:hypothetical protein
MAKKRIGGIWRLGRHANGELDPAYIPPVAARVRVDLKRDRIPFDDPW